jgi:hypothetical protein
VPAPGSSVLQVWRSDRCSSKQHTIEAVSGVLGVHLKGHGRFLGDPLASEAGVLLPGSEVDVFLLDDVPLWRAGAGQPGAGSTLVGLEVFGIPAGSGHFLAKRAKEEDESGVQRGMRLPVRMVRTTIELVLQSRSAEELYDLGLDFGVDPCTADACLKMTS